MSSTTPSSSDGKKKKKLILWPEEIDVACETDLLGPGAVKTSLAECLKAFRGEGKDVEADADASVTAAAGAQDAEASEQVAPEDAAPEAAAPEAVAAVQPVQERSAFFEAWLRRRC